MKARDTALAGRMARLGIREADLRVVCCRASGPGGQHVNRCWPKYSKNTA